jgi:hypothetical protein
MFVKQKKLMSKCRACGNENLLDGSHRAGAQLMKQLPKDMSEIDAKGKEDSKQPEAPSGEAAEEEKKEKKKKTAVEAAPEEQAPEEGLKIDSEEIGKY